MFELLTPSQVTAALLISLAAVPLHQLWKLARAPQTTPSAPQNDPLLQFIALPLATLLLAMLGECVCAANETITFRNQTDFWGFAAFICDLFQTASESIWKIYIFGTSLLLGAPAARWQRAKKLAWAGAPFLIAPFVASAALALMRLEPTLLAHDAWLCTSICFVTPFVAPFVLCAHVQKKLQQLWFKIVHQRVAKPDTKLLKLLEFCRQTTDLQKPELLPVPLPASKSAPLIVDPKKLANAHLPARLCAPRPALAKPAPPVPAKPAHPAPPKPQLAPNHDTVLSFLPAGLMK